MRSVLLVVPLLIQLQSALAYTDPCGNGNASQVCVVDSDHDAQKFASPIEEGLFLMARKCVDSSESQELRERFLKTYDLLPAPIKKIVCGMPRIFIELRKMKGGSGRIYGAYDPASVQFSKEKKKGQSTSVKAKLTGFFFQISKVNFNETLDIPENRSVHEEFAIDSDEKGFDARIPQFRYDMNGLPPERLMSTLVHEASHAVDFYNTLVAKDPGCEEDDKACNAERDKLYKGNAFLQFSWDIKFNWKLNPGLKKLCFADAKCEGKSKVADSDAIMRGLFDSVYGSLYSMENPMEDFAETSLYYFLFKVLGVKSTLHFPGGKTLDFSDVQGRKEFSRKMDYMQKVYTNPALRYSFEKPVWEENQRELP